MPKKDKQNAQPETPEKEPQAAAAEEKELPPEDKKEEAKAETFTVTREQMAAILYRYAAFKGIDVSAAADLGNFADFESVSAYARTAIAWASAEGIINGSADGRLMPKAGATRAQVAAILHRYIENCIF